MVINKGNGYFWKEDLKTNPRNQKSLNLEQDSQRNNQVNKRYFRN